MNAAQLMVVLGSAEARSSYAVEKQASPMSCRVKTGQHGGKCVAMQELRYVAQAEAVEGESWLAQVGERGVQDGTRVCAGMLKIVAVARAWKANGAGARAERSERQCWLEWKWECIGEADHFEVWERRLAILFSIALLDSVLSLMNMVRDSSKCRMNCWIGRVAEVLH